MKDARELFKSSFSNVLVPSHESGNDGIIFCMLWSERAQQIINKSHPYPLLLHANTPMHHIQIHRAEHNESNNSLSCILRDNHSKMRNNASTDIPPSIPKSTDRIDVTLHNILTGRSLDDLGGDNEEFLPPLEIFVRRVSVTDDDRDALDISSTSAFTQSTLDHDSLHRNSNHTDRASASEGYLSATSSVSSLADNIYRAYTSTGGEDNRAPQRIRRTLGRTQNSWKRRQPGRKGGLTRWSSMPRQRAGDNPRNPLLSSTRSSEHTRTIGSEFSPRRPIRQGSFSEEINEYGGGRALVASTSREESMPRLPTRRLSNGSLRSDSDSDDSSTGSADEIHVPSACAA